jgi:hypothetical protein
MSYNGPYLARLVREHWSIEAHHHIRSPGTQSPGGATACVDGFYGDENTLDCVQRPVVSWSEIA